MQRRLLSLEYQGFLLSGELYPSDIPIDHDSANGIIGNEACITVPCRYWNEGPTELVVWSTGEMTEDGTDPDFEGCLETPRRSVACSDVNEIGFLVAEVVGTKTRVRIWLDVPVEPAVVRIALG